MPRNLAKYLLRIVSTLGQNFFLFLMMDVRMPRKCGSVFGSERLPLVEKSCSTLPSCGMWLTVCLNTT